MINVLLFAGMKDKVGKGKISIDVTNISVQELKQRHLSTYNIDVQLEEALVAINEEYATDDTVINSGDTVAFIPPVSGG